LLRSKAKQPPNFGESTDFLDGICRRGKVNRNIARADEDAMCALLRAKAKCPIGRAAREWIDRRWTWLESQFGLELSRNCPVILPEHEFFPDEFGETIDGANSLFERICRYMQVDRGVVDLSFDEDQQAENGFHRGAAGLYFEQNGRFPVAISVSYLADPLALVATMARELARIHLLGGNRISREEPDHEPLADLLTVFFGLGVLTANSVIRERNWHQVTLFGMVASGWRISKSGYLSMPMFGYALARFAKSRSEDRPAWASCLRSDVRSPFQQSMHYLADLACGVVANEPEPAVPDQGSVASAELPSDADGFSAEEEELHAKPDNRAESAKDRLLRHYAAGKRNFAELYLPDACLAEAQLSGCDLTNAYLSGADLNDADLRAANLTNAELDGANLAGAKLQDANLQGADLTRANLTCADLSRADLRGTNLQGAILRNAVLLKSSRDSHTDFTDADLARIVSTEEVLGMTFKHLASYIAGAAMGIVLGFGIASWFGGEFVSEAFGRALGILAALVFGFLVPYFFYQLDCTMWREQLEGNGKPE
jgi:uncharacterized protein YjbI with pentapeptide repeats